MPAPPRQPPAPVLACAGLALLLDGCIATSVLEQTARGDAIGDVAVRLLVQGDAYHLEHWLAAEASYARQGYPPRLTVARATLPAGCPAARFGYAGPAGWLPLAPGDVQVVTAGPAPPAPPCGVTVARDAGGTLVVTGPAGELARLVPAPPRPAALVLAPVAIAADTFVFLAALVTVPVWAPAALGWNHFALKRAGADAAQALAGLPADVTACRDAVRAAATAVDPVRRFDWLPVAPATYAASSGRVGLDGARLAVAGQADRWTDASAECDLAGGSVTASRLRLRD